MLDISSRLPSYAERDAVALNASASASSRCRVVQRKVYSRSFQIQGDAPSRESCTRHLMGPCTI